jgi:hypothetical protein
MVGMSWRGYSKWDGSVSVHIGPLPLRNRVAFYVQRGNQVVAAAYFSSPEEAGLALDVLDELFAGMSRPPDEKE